MPDQIVPESAPAAVNQTSADNGLLTAYQLFIGARNGSPNATFQPRDMDTLENLLRRYFRGYTITPGRGFWLDNHEQVYWEHSKVVTVLVGPGEGGNLQAFTKQIKATLKQLAIAQVELGPAAFV